MPEEIAGEMHCYFEEFEARIGWQYRENKDDERVLISEEDILNDFWNIYENYERKYGRIPKKTEHSKDECIYLWAKLNWAEFVQKKDLTR
jgi:hypothetical protein